MANNEDALRRLREALNDQFDTLDRATAQKVTAIWNASPNYRDADVRRLVAKILPVVQAAQLRIAAAESAYHAAAATMQTGRPVQPAPVVNAVILDTVTDPQARFAQPAGALYTELSKGASFTDALERSVKQLTGITRIALTDARAAQAGASLRSYDVTRYRRVLSGTACDFCRRVIGAGRQEYSTTSLRPLHDKCNCGYDAVHRKVTGAAAADARLHDARREANRRADAVRKARQADPAAQREYREANLERFTDVAAKARSNWGDLDALPLEERRRARREIGIADQRVKEARKTLGL